MRNLESRRNGRLNAYKTEIMEYLDEIDETKKRRHGRAVKNTIVNDQES